MPDRAAEAPAAEAVRAPPARPPGRTWLRRELPYLAELLALTGLTVTQPVLDVTGRSPDFFLFHQATSGDILGFVALVALAPALVLWAAGLVAGLAGRVLGRLARVAIVAGLFTVLAVEVGKKASPLRGVALAAAGVAAGLAATALYARLPAVRLWLRFAAPAPVVFALLFVFLSPTSALVVPSGEGGPPARPLPGVPTGRRPPIVLVMFDEFPLSSLLDSGGRVDGRVFPNFARFAGESTWYRNATGVSGWTPFAMPAMMTGRYPHKAVAAHYSEYPDNLFTLLGGTYELKVQETVSQLCPPHDCGVRPPQPGQSSGLVAILGESARVLRRIASPKEAPYDPTAAYADQVQAQRARPDPAPRQRLNAMWRFDALRENQPARFRDFLDSLPAAAGRGPDAPPTFHFLHLLLPHSPWRYLPSGVQYTSMQRNFGVKQAGDPWSLEARPSDLNRQRLLLQLAYTDRLVGEAVARLRALGLYDRALVVLTADHGVSLAPGRHARRLDRDRGNASDLLWVPLFVKAPDQRAGRVDDRNWEQVDLAPTIAQYAGVRVPWATDGLSALGDRRRGRTDKYYYDVPRQRLVVQGPANQARALRGATDAVGRPQHGPSGLFETGPLADLVGRRADRYPRAGPGPTATVAGLGEFRDVDPATRPVPAYVFGELPAGVARGTPVAIAVNGTIGAVGPAFHDVADDTTRFAGIVPDRLFTRGGNRLELFAVEGAGAALRLRPLAVTGA